MTLQKSFASLIVLLFCTVVAFAQNTVNGIVVDAADNKPLESVVVYLAETDFSTTTDKEGVFKLSGVPDGEYTLVVETELYDAYEHSFTISRENVTIGTIQLVSLEGTNIIAAEDIIPTVSLSETDLESEGSQSVSGLLTASRDVFINTAAFTFGTYRFNIRGYDGKNTQVTMNGVNMNDLERGGAFWSQWGGLNDVTRNRENNIGLEPLFYSFGSVGGVTNIDSRASNQRKQLRVAYSASNRSYFHRLMATYNTGLLNKGWAVSLSASRRWANEGYVPGTNYDAWSYFLSVDKKFGNRNLTSFTVFGAPVRRGKNSPAIEEVYDLAGSVYYNPNWGYQNGEKRNARIAHNHQPTFILSHEFNINEKSRLYGAAGFQFGQNGSTALNWYNAPDPRPDYYRNLPSYIEDSTLRELARQNYINNPELLQLDWDNFYNINSSSTELVENYNGTGRDTTINLARYMIEDRRYDKKKVDVNLLYENNLTDYLKLTTGVYYDWQRSYNYKVIEDLLGADLFIDLNQFAERDFRGNDTVAQNDLANPNRLLEEGDRFGYDYNLTTCKKGGWFNMAFTLPQWDFFVAGDISHTSFFRTGNVRNGLFPDDSEGDSDKKGFLNYGVKGGVTYKVNGRNYLYANGGYLTRAPFTSEAFLSPQTRNQLVDGLESEKIISFEGGYLLKAPKLKARAVFYYTQFLDGMESYSFYYDLERNFVNIALTNIDQRHMGGELAIQGEIFPGFSISGVAALGQYIYTSRQNATITLDNSAEVIAQDQTIFSKNFFVPNGPQMAGNIGLRYSSPKYWFVNLNFNYFDRIFIDFNPIRRTNQAVDLVEPGSELWNDIIQQEQADGQFTMDLFGGFSWKMDNTFKGMKRSYFMYFTVGVNNILNNRNFITGGFEQTRLDVEDRDPSAFPPRYFYSYGTNFFINVAFRL